MEKCILRTSQWTLHFLLLLFVLLHWDLRLGEETGHYWEGKSYFPPAHQRRRLYCFSNCFIACGQAISRGGDETTNKVVRFHHFASDGNT